ncbi:4316_t:CDS:1 [Ambispora gerdemannii]|uniref:4316_t:CDS:1 n=1 Tax=Ambispora gerdemannii TaxID=144530 RepID=A0A9N8ZCK0_9GLOM|nr:4316_t:CDS:1 [Ambispora gerdemannii]
MNNDHNNDNKSITSEENNILKELLELFDELKRWGEPDERAVKRILKWIASKNTLPQNIFQILSTKKDDPPYTCILGFFYNFGIGTPLDLERAFCLYRKSAEAGYLIAQNKVGYCIVKQIGTTASEETALSWFNRAAQAGHLPAQYNLGVCYAQGNCGVEVNESMALYWGEKAARAGHPASQIQLALLYTYGVIVQRNITKAIYWCRKANEARNNVSQHTLGGYYQSGIGVPRDIHMTIKLYRRAQNNDYEFTENSLNCLFKPASKN